ncbi:MAG TPA: hypothetical protein VK666_26950 [Chryseolinea sp.]|nr:hypothetical protein [Chryseolinea sp.]
MTRKSYYILVVILSLIISGYSARFFFRIEGPAGTFWFDLGLVFFILMFEISELSRKLRILAGVMLPIAIIGTLFAVQHWPLTRVLMFAGWGGLVLIPVIHAFFLKQHRAITLMILLYPLLYYIGFVMKNSSWPAGGLVFIVSKFLLVVPVIAIVMTWTKNRNANAGKLPGL